MKIIAHNEQADVDNLQGPSLKGFLLGITGKKQELLEKEQAEAHNAQQNYELAVTRQDSVRHKLEKYGEELAVLGHCEENLGKMIAFPEDASFETLIQCSAKLFEIQDLMTTLMTELVNVSKLGAFRSGTASSSALAGTDDRLMSAERRAQTLVTLLKGELKDFSEHLAPFGMFIDISDTENIEDNYLTDLYTNALITARVEKVTVALRQLRFRLDALKPTLENTTAEYQKENLRTLIAAAEKH